MNCIAWICWAISTPRYALSAFEMKVSIPRILTPTLYRSAVPLILSSYMR